SGEGRGRLVSAPHAEAYTAVRRQATDVAAEEQDPTGARHEIAEDDIEQGGLAGPVGTQRHAALTRRDPQRAVPNGYGSTVTVRNRLEVERRYGRHGGRSLRRHTTDCRARVRRACGRPPRRVPGTGRQTRPAVRVSWSDGRSARPPR